MEKINHLLITGIEKKIKISDYLDLFLKIDEEQVVDVLKAFSYFLSSNKNHRYNITHINDQIDTFIGIIKTIKRKKILYKEVKEELRCWIKLEKKNSKCVLVIDQCFLCDLKSDQSVDFISDLDSFQLNAISSKNISLSVVIEDTTKTDKCEELYLYSLLYKNAAELLSNGKVDIVNKLKTILI